MIGNYLFRYFCGGIKVHIGLPQDSGFILFIEFPAAKTEVVILKRLTKNYKALLFDLNGTMIDDMQYHIIGWHRILTALGADISLEKTKKECYGKNHEFLERIFPGIFSEEEKDQ